MISTARRFRRCRAFRRAASPRALGLLFAAAALCINPALAAGKDFAPGTWTGEFKRPAKKAQRASIVLAESDDGAVEIEELIVHKDHYALSKVKLKSKRIQFTWEPGDDPVRCDLKQQDDGRFEGPCKDPAGDEIATLTVIPPPPEDVAADSDDAADSTAASTADNAAAGDDTPADDSADPAVAGAPPAEQAD